MASTRTFATGATRNDDAERIDPEGFLSPKVMLRYFEYMHKNRFRENGEVRDSDNWQQGIPQEAYAKSASRHYWEFFDRHRELGAHTEQDEKLIEICCAQMFNAMGFLFEELKKPKAAAARDFAKEQEQAWRDHHMKLYREMERRVDYPRGDSTPLVDDETDTWARGV